MSKRRWIQQMFACDTTLWRWNLTLLTSTSKSLGLSMDANLHIIQQCQQSATTWIRVLNVMNCWQEWVQLKDLPSLAVRLLEDRLRPDDILVTGEALADRAFGATFNIVGAADVGVVMMISLLLRARTRAEPRGTLGRPWPRQHGGRTLDDGRLLRTRAALRNREAWQLLAAPCPTRPCGHPHVAPNLAQCRIRVRNYFVNRLYSVHHYCPAASLH